MNEKMNESEITEAIKSIQEELNKWRSEPDKQNTIDRFEIICTELEFTAGQLAIIKSNMKAYYKLVLVLLLYKVKRNKTRRLQKKINERDETTATIGFDTEKSSEVSNSFADKKILGFGG